MKWVGLVRVSSNEQHGGTLTQAETITKWCAERGDELVAIFYDEGVPGTMEALPRRRAIGAALEVLALKQCDGVLITKLDRLARDLALQEQLIAEFQRKGGLVLSCHPGEADLLGPNVNEPTRKLIRQVLGAVGEFDRAMIQYRSRAGATRARASGQWMGGRPPYGFKRVGVGKLEPDEREQSIIGEALVLRDDYRLSYQSVGEFLVQAGMPPKGLHTTVHARTTVAGILASAARKGIRRRSLSALGRQFAGVLPEEQRVTSASRSR